MLAEAPSITIWPPATLRREWDELREDESAIKDWHIAAPFKIKKNIC
jgi:hypothetical protein